MGDLLPFPKNPRETDEEYIRFLRTRPCVLCQRPQVDPHHSVSRGAWGSDYFSIPVCPACHALAHAKGQAFLENIVLGSPLARLSTPVLGAIIVQLVAYIKKMKMEVRDGRPPS